MATAKLLTLILLLLAAAQTHETTVEVAPHVLQRDTIFTTVVEPGSGPAAQIAVLATTVPPADDAIAPRFLLLWVALILLIAVGGGLLFVVQTRRKPDR